MVKVDPANLSPPCALCGVNRKLEQSHIIPQFVYRWRSKVSALGDSQPAVSGDRRSQDGATRPLLCGRCEDSFSSYESEFARQVFHPFVTNSTLRAKYGGWLRKFSVSVCWRILEDRIASQALEYFAGRWTAQLASCRDSWKQYLVGKRPDVGDHHVHLLSWNSVADETHSTATGFALDRTGGPALAAVPSQVQRSIEMAVSCRDTEAFVYAKLGPIVLFGLIADPDLTQWQGTRINAEGKLKPREVLVPNLYLEYLRSRINPSESLDA